MNEKFQEDAEKAVDAIVNDHKLHDTELLRRACELAYLHGRRDEVWARIESQRARIESQKEQH